MLGLGLKAERTTPTREELVKRAGSVLYLDARKVNGLTVGINSPLTATFKDLSNNNDDLTLNAFTGTTSDGYDGNTLVFDGVDSYLSIDNSSTLDITGTGNFGMSTILQIQNGAGTGYICAKNDTGYADVRYGLLYEGGILKVISSGVILLSSQVITQGVWYRISVVRDNGILYLILNGQIVAQTPSTTSLVSASKFRVGCRVNGTGNSIFCKMKLATLIITKGPKSTLTNGIKAMNKIQKGYL